MNYRVLTENIAISAQLLDNLEERDYLYDFPRYAIRHTFHQQASLCQTPLKISYLIRRLTSSICSSPG